MLFRLMSLMYKEGRGTERNIKKEKYWAKRLNENPNATIEAKNLLGTNDNL